MTRARMTQRTATQEPKKGNDGADAPCKCTCASATIMVCLANQSEKPKLNLLWYAVLEQLVPLSEN